MKWQVKKSKEEVKTDTVTALPAVGLEDGVRTEKPSAKVETLQV